LVTHPFHPYSGREGAVVAARYNRFGKRLLLRFDDGVTCPVPAHWTDLVAPDPEVVTGKGRSAVRVIDLIELAKLTAALGGQSPVREGKMRKGNFAATVKPITPQ
jgi:hypothetical protein